MKIKGVYKFICEALDIEETITINEQHTWQEVKSSFYYWLVERTDSSWEEVSYTEDGKS